MTQPDTLPNDVALAPPSDFQPGQDGPQASTSRDAYRALKQELLHSEMPPDASLVDLQPAVLRDEFGDAYHDPDADGEMLHLPEEAAEGHLTHEVASDLASLLEQEDAEASQEGIPGGTETGLQAGVEDRAFATSPPMTAEALLRSIRERRAQLADADAHLRYEDKPGLMRELQELEEHLLQMGASPGNTPSQHVLGHAARSTKGAHAHPAWTAATAHAPQPPYTASLRNREPAHLPPLIASGSARTTAPSVSTVENTISSINSPDQLELLKLQLLGRTAA